MILRYTCTACGLWTRVEPGNDHVICRCEAPYEVLDESPEAPPAEPQP